MYKIVQMLVLNLFLDIVCVVMVEQVVGLIGVDIGCGGIIYLVGGWLCLQQFIVELLVLVVMCGLYVYYGYFVEMFSVEGDGWLFNQQCYYQVVVLVNGYCIIGFV